jgi:hypothetical protein
MWAMRARLPDIRDAAAQANEQHCDESAASVCLADVALIAR